MLKLCLLILFIAFQQLIYSQFEPENFEFENADSVINYLEGEWEWVKSCGGQLMDDCIYPEEAGYTKRMVFKKIENIHDSIEYFSYISDTLRWTGICEVDYFKTNPFGWVWSIIGVGYIAKVNENMANFQDGYTGGYENYYQRIVPVSVQAKIIKKVELRVYPNPCTKSLKLNVDNRDIIDYVYLYDAGGSIISYYENYRTNKFIDISTISKGLYFVRIVVGETQYMERFIKQ